MRRLLYAGAALALVGTSLAQPAAPKARGFDKDSIGIDQKLGNRIPLETKWRDEFGEDVTLGEFFHNKKPVIIVPVFYRCKAACLVVFDKTVKSVMALQARYPNDEFEVVAFSIDPTETAIDAKVTESGINKVYVEGAHNDKEEAVALERAKETWHFLTGDIDAVTKLTTAIGFRFTYEPEIDRINHATGIMVATPEGKLASYLMGSEFPAPAIRNSLEIARKEQVGPEAEPILLGCFMMDPATGKYRLVVQQALKVAGIGTLLILSASIFVLSTKNKQRPRSGGPSTI
ncbi:MAG: hypothetical protein JNK63_00670 [Chthonomonas sp.]|nr:hypothetical protein [Chthonomonas sp.]